MDRKFKRETRAYASFMFSLSEDDISILDEKFEWDKIKRHLRSIAIEERVFKALETVSLLINVCRLQKIELSKAKLPNLSVITDYKEIDEGILLEALDLAKREILSLIPADKSVIFSQMLKDFSDLYESRGHS